MRREIDPLYTFHTSTKSFGRSVMKREGRIMMSPLRSVLECSSPLELFESRRPYESGGGPPHSRTLPRAFTCGGEFDPAACRGFYCLVTV